MKSPNDMTLDELRDELAESQGWKWVDHGLGWWERGTESDGTDHPIPATLQDIAAAMPEGWTWKREYMAPLGQSERGLVLMWIAFHDARGEVYVEDSGDEKLDRARLAVACWRASKKESKP